MIHLTHQINGLFQIQIFQFHHTAHTDRKRCRNIDTDMRNMLSGQYDIRSTSHNNHIFLFCQLTD